MPYEKKRAIRFWFGLLGVVLVVTVVASHRKSGPTLIAQERRSPVLVTTYDRPEITDPAERALRRIRDKHYERFTFGLPSLDLVGGGGTTDCYAPGVREKLALEQDTVLVGGIIDAHVYLNSTKQHVYTEYRVRVEQVLKSGGDALSPGKEIVTGRWGGGIQFSSGEVREYWVRKLGMPDVGQRYLFFLQGQKEGGDFYIWTAFKLNNDSITVIDQLDSKLFPLAAYEGSNEVEFFSKVRKALARSQRVRKPKEN
jgi:hypothetical protein